MLTPASASSFYSREREGGLRHARTSASETDLLFSLQSPNTLRSMMHGINYSFFFFSQHAVSILVFTKVSNPWRVTQAYYCSTVLVDNFNKESASRGGNHNKLLRNQCMDNTIQSFPFYMHQRFRLVLRW